MYSILEEKHVPHTDSLALANKFKVVLHPRGLARQPQTERQLLNAIICVLEALKVSTCIPEIITLMPYVDQVLHRQPAVYHRDVRWPNIIRRLDDHGKYCLIDFDDAAFGPTTTAQLHMNKQTHSPEVFKDGHGGEVDVWGVGDLIKQSHAEDIQVELKELGKWMQGPGAPSAEEALDKVQKYRDSKSAY
jgi:hypothetical protein